MRNVLLVTLLSCFSVSVCSGQRPSFETASVKIVDPASHPAFGTRGGPGTANPGRIHLCCVGMFALLMRAYDVEVDRIVGPSWITEIMGPNLYEVDATMPSDTTKAQFQLMMQSMLEERFHLVIHRESRNFPGYELVLAKGGPKLKESTSDPGAGADSNAPQVPKRGADGWFTLPPGPQMMVTFGGRKIRVQVQGKPISELVKSIGRMIAQSLGESMSDFTSRNPRVIDRTGLTGKYDFTLEFSCEGCTGFGTTMSTANVAGAQPQTSVDNLDSGLPSIFVALEKQIGLKLLKSKDISLDVIVLDKVEKVPTEN